MADSKPPDLMNAFKMIHTCSNKFKKIKLN